MYEFYQDLIAKNDSKIVLFVMDGLGGLPREAGGKTELATARTPNLDRLAAKSSCGLIEPVLPGVTPGSGPSHLALFGYDPLQFRIGRGVMEALGVNFPVEPGDLCVRLNFATADAQGVLTDRRAGRPKDEETVRLAAKLQKAVAAAGYEIFFRPVKEHRAALVVRGPGLAEGIHDTDPQVTGRPPLPVVGADPAKTRRTVELLTSIVAQAERALADEPRANRMLLRGISFFHPLPTLEERFGLRSCGIAAYPMYKGLARLAGMAVDDRPKTPADLVAALGDRWADFDFFFVHYKYTDSSGEDGDFDRKVRMIEEADALLPGIEALGPDVLAVTGDHSTPAVMKGHSWHPVPVLLRSRWSLTDNLPGFDEVSCARGTLGHRPTLHLMGLLMAHAQRLSKYGA
jgi:2,3-bisphosphoglycerate-independent phosphoglycerate mutase